MTTPKVSENLTEGSKQYKMLSDHCFNQSLHVDPKSGTCGIPCVAFCATPVK